MRMNPELLYVENPSIKMANAEVANCGVMEGEIWWAELSSTPFYPEGGGQAGDVGLLHGLWGTLFVERTLRSDGHVRHVGRLQGELRVGAACRAEIDWPSRWLNTRIHSAGECICLVLEKLLPAVPVTKANHRVAQSSITIATPVAISERDAFVRCLEEGVADLIRAGIAISTATLKDRERALALCGFLPAGIDLQQGIRIVQIGTEFARPCCGTHVSNTQEIGVVKVRSLAVRGAETRIGYDVAAAAGRARHE